MQALAVVTGILGALSVHWLMGRIQGLNAVKPAARHYGVSIIIVSNNQAVGLKKLLKSIDASFGGNCQIICADLSSGGTSVDTAKKHGIEAIVISEESGLVDKKNFARYVAAKKAVHKMLLFIDASYLPQPGFWPKLFACWKAGTVVSAYPYEASANPLNGLGGMYMLLCYMASEAFALYTSPSPSLNPGCMLIAREDYFNSIRHDQVSARANSARFLSKGYDKSGLGVRVIFSGSLMVEPSSFYRDLSLSFSSAKALLLVAAYISGGIFLALCARASYIESMGWVWLYLIYGLSTTMYERQIGEYSIFWALLWPLQLLYALIAMLLHLYLKKSRQPAPVSRENA
ncbi:MAG: glycosyltransferase family 2 protein [Eubacteriaceae bacterium]|nr:glycosyltransferase family 2 protein [Eubacteriaceae bacterium]